MAGIEIRIHRSWIIIALLIAWSFWSRFTLSGQDTAAALTMAAVATVLFFGSVLVHELAHSLEAQHRGVEVSGITLFLFGGATETSFNVERPRDEFALTAVGPFSSFVLAAIFGLIAFYSSGAGLEAVAEVAGLIGWINLALGIFNLLPGAPLDGGRVLRSAVWAATGDRGRAVRVASRSGQVIGYLIVGLGLLQLFFVAGGLVGGIWLIFIGWFLANAAQSEIVQHELRGGLEGMTVGELVGSGPLPSVDAGTDLATAAEQLRRQAEDAIVVTRDGETVGVMLPQDIGDVPAEQRGDTPVGEVAAPIDDLRTMDADTEVADALGGLGENRPIVVTSRQGDTDRIEGIITPEQLQRVVKRTMQMGAKPRVGAGRGRSGREETHLPDADRS